MKPLPRSSQILPVSIPLRIPNFLNHYIAGVETLAPCEIQPEDWFEQFANRTINCLGKQYLPICRLSDGEFCFLLGEQRLDASFPWIKRAKHRLRMLVRSVTDSRIFTPGGSAPNGTPLYSSGAYSAKEVVHLRSEYTKCLYEIAQTGVLALHLTHGTPRPFQQLFFPALGRWLEENQIVLDLNNYVPFYFVYALLRGPRKKEILKDQRILIVHGATGLKQQAIIHALEKEGARKIFWAAISPDRSWFDRPEIGPFIGRVDVCLVGAGVGKPRILIDLKRLEVPCIDAGYVFEVWADESVAPYRPFIVPDDDPRSHELLHLSPEERSILQRRLMKMRN